MESFMKKSILITGGTGYLGGRLTNKLAELGNYNLFITSHKSPALYKPWLKKNKIIKCDILSGKEITKICESIDIVVHLAALNEIDSLLKPEQAVKTNILATLRLLNSAKSTRVKRFIYLSTAHVYGKSLKGKVSEETIPKPVHPYAITHKAAEDFILAANDKSLKSVVLRLSNAFGYPAHPYITRWTLVVNDFCKQAVLNKEIKLNSPGSQYRDFIPIEDVENAIVHFMHLPNSRLYDGLFNLGGENPLRILDIASYVSNRCYKILGYKPKIIKPTSKENITSEKLDFRIDKLKSTDFSLKGDMNNEIDKTLTFCFNNFKRNN